MKTQKQSCSKELFGLDWSDFFTKNGLDPLVDAITSSTWTLTSGTKGSEFVATPETSLFIEGGSPGTTINAENTVEVNGGAYRDCRTLFIEVS